MNVARRRELPTEQLKRRIEHLNVTSDYRFSDHTTTVVARIVEATT